MKERGRAEAAEEEEAGAEAWAVEAGKAVFFLGGWRGRGEKKGE